MLRLFRNFLCFASVLQVGTAVQAQQPPAKSATAPVAKVSPAGSTKTAKKEPVVVSAKAGAPVTAATPPSTKSPVTKPEAAAKPETKSSTSKPVKAESVPISTKSTKTGPASAATKAAKTEPAATPPLKMGPAKPVKSEKVAQQKHAPMPRPGLVPPPPPDTPTMFAGDGFPPGFGMFDYNNPAALAGRRKDIASQLASAKKLLIDKEQRAKELKEKAVQFEQLFSEGVISRRELESAQKDSASAITELSDAKTQAISYQNAMSRLDARMKPKSVAAKKNAKGKIKAAAQNSIKVAGKSTTPAKTVVTTAAPATSAAPATTAAPTTPSSDSTAQTATKATPGP